MSARLANITRGSADVVVDGKVVGWVVRNTYDVEDEDGKFRGRVVHAWDAVMPGKYGGGEVNSMPHTYRRDAMEDVVRQATGA